MKITVISKNYGTQTIDTDNFCAYRVSTHSTIFRIIERVFDDWFETYTQPGAPMGRDILGMYNGEVGQPAIYTKSGAIRGGIEAMIEALSESEANRVIINTRQIISMDLEATFI